MEFHIHSKDEEDDSLYETLALYVLHGKVRHEKIYNSSAPGQNGRNCTDGISRCIFVNEKICILIKILPKFVPKGPVDNNTLA